MNMKHKLLNILAASSFLLCITTGAAESDARANMSKVLRDVPYEFMLYDAVNSKMLYKDSLPGIKEERRGGGDAEEDLDDSPVRGKYIDPKTGKPISLRNSSPEAINRARDAMRKREAENAKNSKKKAAELMKADFAERLGLTMPEGSKADYDERSGKLTIRSSKEDVETVEKLLADYKKMETWFSRQLDETKPISGTCYTNLNAVFLVTVSDALLDAYSKDEKKSPRKKKKNKKKATRNEDKSQKVETVIAELDKKRALIFVFEKNVNHRKVEEFKEALGIKDSICVYETEIPDDFKDLQTEGAVVLISCYGEVVDTFTSLNGIKNRSKDIAFWHKQGYRRVYRK